MSEDYGMWIQLNVALTEIESLWGVLEFYARREFDGGSRARKALEESRRNLVDRLDYGTKEEEG